ncbi:MAG: hypothetical protein FJZ01_20120 [Candidatus Sericytochromatia bacterium]|nr:hypothetical protein [Candidatus Tanganyikabacteria bacterium]
MLGDLDAKTTGLPRDSVARTDQMVAINKDALTERAGRVGPEVLDRVFARLDLVLGRA